MALPGKAKESDKQHSKQQKLKTAINKVSSLSYRKKGSMQQSNRGEKRNQHQEQAGQH